MTKIPVTQRDRPSEDQDRPKVQTLAVGDRCDRCGAQAFVRVAVPVFELANDVELLFCGHHFAKHEAHITDLGYEVVDERWAINLKPSPSASEGEGL